MQRILDITVLAMVLVVCPEATGQGPSVRDPASPQDGLPTSDANQVAGLSAEDYLSRTRRIYASASNYRDQGDFEMSFASTEVVIGPELFESAWSRDGRLRFETTPLLTDPGGPSRIVVSGSMEATAISSEGVEEQYADQVQALEDVEPLDFAPAVLVLPLLLGGRPERPTLLDLDAVRIDDTEVVGEVNCIVLSGVQPLPDTRRRVIRLWIGEEDGLIRRVEATTETERITYTATARLQPAVNVLIPDSAFIDGLSEGQGEGYPKAWLAPDEVPVTPQDQ